MAEGPKAGLLIIFATVFVDLLGFGIVLPLLPRYAQYFGAKEWQLGLLMASFSAMQFLFAPIWGRLSDRVGRRPILILGLAGSTLSYAAFGYVTGLHNERLLLGLGAIPWLFITRIAAGIAGATIPTAQAYIADVTGPHERARGMALIGAAFGIGFTFGPLIGAAFVSNDPLAPPSPGAGYAASVLSGLALISAIFVLPESLRPDSVRAGRTWLDLSAFSHALAKPAIGLVLLAMFLATFGFAQFESTLSLLTKSLGLAEKHNFYVFAYIGFVLALSQGFLVRRLVPRVGEHRMAMAGAAAMAFGLLLVGWAGSHGSIRLLYAVLPIAVIGFSALNPCLQSMLSLWSSSSEQGAMLGVGQSIAALARILGPFVGMLLYGRSHTLPYWSGAGLLALSLALVMTMRRPAYNALDAAP